MGGGFSPIGGGGGGVGGGAYLPLSGGELTNPGNLRVGGDLAVGAAMPADALLNSLIAATASVRNTPVLGGSGESGARFGFNCYLDDATPTMYRYLEDGPAAHLVQTDQAGTNGTWRLYMAPRGLAGQPIPLPGQPGGWYLVNEQAIGTTSAGILLNGAVGIGDRPPVTAPHGSLSISNLPSSDPGAGSKALWYDPVDGTVKYSP